MQVGPEPKSVYYSRAKALYTGTVVVVTVAGWLDAMLSTSVVPEVVEVVTGWWPPPVDGVWNVS